jgi:hypothetical protein
LQKLTQTRERRSTCCNRSCYEASVADARHFQLVANTSRLQQRATDFCMLLNKVQRAYTPSCTVSPAVTWGPGCPAGLNTCMACQFCNTGQGTILNTP